MLHLNITKKDSNKKADRPVSLSAEFINMCVLKQTVIL